MLTVTQNFSLSGNFCEQNTGVFSIVICHTQKISSDLDKRKRWIYILLLSPALPSKKLLYSPPYHQVLMEFDLRQKKNHSLPNQGTYLSPMGFADVCSSK